MAGLILVFLAGWFVGLLVEYLVHWLLHYRKIAIHINHHKDFFKLSPQEVAEKSLCLSTDFRYALYVFAGLSPLMFIWGWVPVLTFFIGMAFQLVVVYETCHFALHFDAHVPGFLRRTRYFKWWRQCHLAHHFHSPRGNYSVSFPPLDWLLGTYVEPRDSYPDDPRTMVKHRDPEK
jgi:sterol desaturase/sphingolipid hydroxylase (fatty acid hydroxylase superfamily)